MKKYLISVLFLFSSLYLFSLDRLDYGIITGFETSYNLLDIVCMSENNKQIGSVDHNNSISIQMQFGYRIKQFRIIGTYLNTLYPLRVDKFSPVNDRYTIDISYTFKNIKLGFSHYCDHPVNAINKIDIITKDEALRKIYLSYYKEF